MILTAHQPLYLPWLGFFHKAAASDVICILDNVQYSKGDFISRNLIKGKDGKRWLNVGIKTPRPNRHTISEIELLGNGWQTLHLKMIEESYRKAFFFPDIFPRLSKVYSMSNSAGLAELNYALILFLLEEMKIDVQILRSSSLKKLGTKSNLILDICKKTGADRYLSGVNGRDYLVKSDFDLNNIEVKLQNYVHPKYDQLYPPFLPNLSVLDLLFNYGPESQDIMLEGNNVKWDLMESL